MSMYQPGIPTGTVQLDEDYLNIQHNFTQLDTTYGIDHYKFSDQTANNGFHNTVTTPLIVGGVHPTTAANVPKFYGMQQNVPLGVLQFSRGGSDAVPSPVTFWQSSSAAINLPVNPGSTVLLEFAGIPRAIVKIYAADFTEPMSVGLQNRFNEAIVWWNGMSFKITNTTNTVLIVEPDTPTSSTQLRIRNNDNANAYANVYWTMQFLRLS